MITMTLADASDFLDTSPEARARALAKRRARGGWSSDGKVAGEGVKLSPGSYELERRESPYGYKNSPWLFLPGTSVGFAEKVLIDFAGHEASGITLRERIWVLSLWQPWATLMAIGAKVIETRGWATSYRGEVHIHATKGVPASDRRWVSEFQRLDTVRQAFYRTRPDLLETWGEMFPTGKILGRTRLLDCRSTDVRSEWDVLGVKLPLPPGPHTTEYAFGDYGPGRWMWLTEGAEAFPVPIAAQGRQKLWTMERNLAQV